MNQRCTNRCFGGNKRNQLLMAPTRSIYFLYVNNQGAPGM